MCNIDRILDTWCVIFRTLISLGKKLKFENFNLKRNLVNMKIIDNHILSVNVPKIYCYLLKLFTM